MRQYNMEKTDRMRKTKAIFATLLLHFGLLYGLFYMNNEKVLDIIPSFAKEWIGGEKTEEAAVASTQTHKNRP